MASAWANDGVIMSNAVAIFFNIQMTPIGLIV